MRAFAGQQLRERQAPLLLLAALALLVLPGWAWSLRSMSAHHHGIDLAALFAMWAAMSVAMMIPVEAPSLLRAARARPALAATAAFLGGYLLSWMAFSVCVALTQERLHQRGWIDAAMALRDARSSAVLLLAAGLLQLSPLRQACLSRCRAESLAARSGGLTGGLRAGAASIGCCGLLMLVPFATGAMAIWMVALTALLVVEREFPRAARTGTLAGVLLLALSAWKLAT